MLQKLNERIQGLVAWIIIIMVAVTFTLFGVDYYLQKPNGVTSIVDVNGQPINKSSFDLSYKRIRQLHESSTATHESDRQLKQQLLNEMIMNKVSLQSAALNGFVVSASQADAAILSIPQFQENGRFSTNRYEQALNNAFFTPQSFQQEVAQSMLLNQQRAALIGAEYSLPAEINKFVKLYMQQRDYKYFIISKLNFLKKTPVTEQEIEAYYSKHIKDFITPEMVSIDYIQLSISDIKRQININDVELKQYYDENKSMMVKPFNELKNEIKEQIISDRAQTIYSKKLEELSDLSYQTPDSLNSVSKILALPIQHSNIFAREGSKDLLVGNLKIIQAAFSRDVKILGNNSDPIQVDNDTVVVLRVNKHIKSAKKPLKDVSGLIIDKLSINNAEKEAARLGDALLNLRDNQLKLNELMQKHKLVWTHIKLAGRDTDKVSKSINELVFNIAINSGKIGKSLDNGNYVVVFLDGIHEGKLSSLDKEHKLRVQQQIEASYGVMDYELYINKLMEQAKIVRH